MMLALFLGMGWSGVAYAGPVARHPSSSLPSALPNTRPNPHLCPGPALGAPPRTDGDPAPAAVPAPTRR